jgi:hypothetical protein
MFKRKLHLLVMAMLLLSPTLADARDLDTSGRVSVGDIQINSDRSGNLDLQTPNIEIEHSTSNNLDRDESPEYPVTIARDFQRRTYRRRYYPIRSPRSYRRYITLPKIYSEGRIRDRRTTIIRSSDLGGKSRLEEYNTYCSESSTISSQQSTTISNGRSTVSSRIYTNCR